jgi:hypothetical protein
MFDIYINDTIYKRMWDKLACQTLVESLRKSYPSFHIRAVPVVKVVRNNG